MKIKTFYTKSMTDALREIKAELGSDALILSTREVPRRSGVWGSTSGFEVVAAIDDSETIDEFSFSPEQGSVERRASSQDRNKSELQRDVILAETYSGAGLIKKPADVQPKSAASRKSLVITAQEGEQDEQKVMGLPFKGRVPLSLYRDLVRCGVDDYLARELMMTALEQLPIDQRISRPTLTSALAMVIHSLMAGSSTHDGMPGKKVIAFVGPPGVGKTTSIAKLAAHLALKNKKNVILMTLDGYRIGGIEQLRSYAGLMGVPFRFIDQASALPQAIQENSRRDYILLDTAGHGPKEMDMIENMAAVLNQSEHIERHLVLSAATKPADLRRSMDRFERCRPEHLIFTKLDETATAGPILNELVRTQKSFSYYSNGQRVPDDLHAVTMEGIIDIVLGSGDEYRTLNQNEHGLKE
jgi:flagellar biosynthesis protein FlhF